MEAGSRLDWCLCDWYCNAVLLKLYTAGQTPCQIKCHACIWNACVLIWKLAVCLLRMALYKSWMMRGCATWQDWLKVGMQFLSQAVSRLLYVLVTPPSAVLMSSVCLFKPPLHQRWCKRGGHTGLWPGLSQPRSIMEKWWKECRWIWSVGITGGTQVTEGEESWERKGEGLGKWIWECDWGRSVCLC